MLIKEIRDYTKDVPEKKIIMDQMDPSETARLVFQIAAFDAVDAVRGHPDKDISAEDMDSFIENVIEELNRLTTSSNMKKAIKDTKRGKV